MSSCRLSAARLAGAALALSTLALARADAGETEAERELPAWGRGPIEVQDPWLQLTYPGLARASSPAVLEPGEIRVGLRDVWSNDFAVQPSAYRVIDGETHDVTLSGRIGAWPRIELGVDVIERSASGGTLDRFIEGFHRALELPDADRSLRPRNAFLLLGDTPRGRPFRITGGAESSAIELGARVLLLDGAEHGVALTLGTRLRIPLDPGKWRGSTPGFEKSISLEASKRVLDLPLVAYFGVSYVHVGGAGLGGTDLIEHHGMTWIGLEWEIAPRASIVAHLWYETPRDRDARDKLDFATSRTIAYVAFGVRVEPIDGLLIDVGAVENLLGLDVTTDVSFMISIAFRFGT